MFNIFKRNANEAEADKRKWHLELRETTTEWKSFLVLSKTHSDDRYEADNSETRVLADGRVQITNDWCGLTGWNDKPIYEADSPEAQKAYGEVGRMLAQLDFQLPKEFLFLKSYQPKTKQLKVA